MYSTSSADVTLIPKIVAEESTSTDRLQVPVSLDSEGAAVPLKRGLLKAINKTNLVACRVAPSPPLEQKLEAPKT